MFLCKRITNYQQMIAVGQILIAVGILFVNIDRFGWFELSDMARGFFHGMGFTLMVFSAFFNIKGLLMWRKGKEGNA